MILRGPVGTLTASFSFSSSFGAPPTLNLILIPSPIVVVPRSGPARLPFSAPNLGIALRSATVCETVVVTRVRLIRRVVLTFLSSSLSDHSTTVLMPVAGSVVSVGGGSSSSSACASRSALSPQIPRVANAPRSSAHDVFAGPLLPRRVQSVTLALEQPQGRDLPLGFRQARHVGMLRPLDCGLTPFAVSVRRRSEAATFCSA